MIRIEWIVECRYRVEWINLMRPACKCDFIGGNDLIYNLIEESTQMKTTLLSKFHIPGMSMPKITITITITITAMIVDLNHLGHASSSTANCWLADDSLIKHKLVHSWLRSAFVFSTWQLFQNWKEGADLLFIRCVAVGRSGQDRQTNKRTDTEENQSAVIPHSGRILYLTSRVS